MQLSSISSISQRYEHIYVSPHMDDVAFSCAGRIAAQRRAGETVLVVTVFTGDIPEKQKTQHRIFKGFFNIQQRKAEDRKAMEILDVDYLWLDYSEQLFRHKWYTLARLHFFSSISGEDKKLGEELLSEIARICRAARTGNLYLPLGVGHHLDHRMIFEMGGRLQQALEKDLSLCFYEDVPYVFIANRLKYRIKAAGLNYNAVDYVKDLTEEKSFVQEILETYKSILGMHFLSVQLRNPIAKILLFLILLFIFIIYLPKRKKSELDAMMISPEVCDISLELRKKLEAAEAYRSQIELLVGSIERFQTHLADYSLTIGGAKGRYLERYWKVIAR